MKRLTELVHLREKLTQAYDPAPISAEIKHLNAKLHAIITEREVIGHQSALENLMADSNLVNDRLLENQQVFDQVIDRIDAEILNEGQKFFSDNYGLERQVEEEAVTITRQVRVMELSESLINEILNRINMHSNWKYPALEIGCRDGEWTRHLVASDPLYITDQYPDFINATVEQFEMQYQRRIRPYLIKDHDLSALPSGQMGFVFCWNFLNYRSLDTVKEYLKEVKNLLRPGGTFMFSYNNGDIPECAGYVDCGWMSYIPKSMLLPMCESLGFEILYSKDVRGEGTSVSWVELKKHGELKTIKASQVMGEIIDIAP
jgi:SAM-dependent methyltransferase